jgi:hypothetical protein
VTSKIGNLDEVRSRDTLDFLYISKLKGPYDCFIDVILYLGNGIIFLPDVKPREAILRGFAPWHGPDNPAGKAVYIHLPSRFIVVFLDVSLFQIFKLEISVKKSARAAFQVDPTLPMSCGDPHPVIGLLSGMVDDQEGHSFYLRRIREVKDDLAGALRTHTLKLPSLFYTFATRTGDLQQPLVAQ